MGAIKERQKVEHEGLVHTATVVYIRGLPYAQIDGVFKRVYLSKNEGENYTTNLTQRKEN